MLTVEQTKKLLNNPALSDEMAEKIRDDFRLLAEVIFKKQRQEKLKTKLQNEYETET